MSYLELRKFILSGSTGSFIVQSIGAVAAAGLSIFLARILGPGQYGIFSFTYSLLFLFALLAKFGTDTASMRYISSYLSEKDTYKLLNFLKLALTVVVLGSLISILIFYSLFHFKFFNTNSFPDAMLIPALIGIPLLALLHLAQYSLRGFHAIVLSQIPESILRPSILFLGCLFLWMGEKHLDAVTVINLNNLSLLIACLVAAYLLFKRIPKSYNSISKLPYKSIIFSLTSFTLISGIHLVLSQTDILMLGFSTSPDKVGYYAAAARIGILVVFTLNAVSSALAPIISSLHSKNEIEKLEKIANFSSKLSFYSTLPIFLMIIFFGEQILSFFGEEFKFAYHALVILSLGQLVKSFFGPIGFLLTMTGEEKTATKIYGTSAIVNVLLNFLLIPILGIKGAAISTAASSILAQILAALVVKRNLNFIPNALNLKKDR